MKWSFCAYSCSAGIRGGYVEEKNSDCNESSSVQGQYVNEYIPKPANKPRIVNFDSRPIRGINSNNEVIAAL